MTHERSQPTAPPRFEDAEKRSWCIKLTLRLIDKVLQNTGIDLAPDDAGDIDPVISLVFDHRKLGDVLWCCVESQAATCSVSRDSFFDALDGPALSLGWKAVIDAIVFFIRSKSPTLGQALEQAIQIKAKFLERGAAKILETLQSGETDASLQRELDQLGERMQRDLTKALGNSATSSEASSG